MKSMTADELRGKVCDAYSAAAASPQGKHPFPVGRAFAVSLGYPAALLDELSSEAVDSFTGVSNVSLFASIPSGATVLDLGCGAGLDSLIAARRVGASGEVIGIDFSESMLARACQAAEKTAVGNVTFCQADAESLPIESGSIDVALVNGIFNLNPVRERIFEELARVVRVGGAVFAAELILSRPLPEATRQDEANWFA